MWHTIYLKLLAILFFRLILVEAIKLIILKFLKINLKLLENVGVKQDDF